MSPLLKRLLKKRNKKRKNKDNDNSLTELNRRITEIITDNKEKLHMKRGKLAPRRGGKS